MRQGNGAELLGSNDPRSGTIGVIDVAPTDDREGVVAAILTQDKLGRKQIVVNLPADNKAFQRPIDFDGLKNMRRKLQAQLVIVAPGGSAPAEFARQRRFPVYSSKENFKQSLGTGPQPAEPPSGRWLFGTSKPKLQPVDASSANGNGKQPAPPSVVPVPLPVDAGMQSPPDPAPQNEPAAPEATPSLPADEPDEDEATAMPAPVPIMFPGPAHSSNSHNQTTEPDPDEQADAADEAHDNGHDAGPVPLLLPVVPPSPAPTVQPRTPSINQPPKRNSGKMVALGGAGAAGAAGGAMVARASAGGPPPPIPPRAGGPPPSRPPQRRRLWLLALVALLIASLLIFGGFALAAPGVFGSFGKAVKNAVSGSPAATVTITPKSQKLTDNFTILAVTGKPNGNQRQVQARVLTVTTAPSKATAKATGHTQTPATNATGTLTFYNGSTSVQVVLADTVFNAGGVQIENTTRAVIPAGNPPSSFGSVTVPARAISAGSRGNIPAYTLHGAGCCGGPISVSNTSAFHGGQDPQNFTFIQQSDVNNAAAPLASQLKTQAMSSVAGQKHAGEQFVKEPACSTKVVANPPVGAHANSTTVTVTATCTGEVYDASGAQVMAVNLLKEKAATNPGPHYVLVGSVQAGAPQVAAINSQTNTVELLVQAAGVWEYQFSDAEKAQLAQLIAGKTKDAAQALLLQQPGVAQVDSISIANGGTTLPTDATQISIVIQNVPGQPGITPTAGPPGSPTPSSGTPVTGNG